LKHEKVIYVKCCIKDCTGKRKIGCRDGLIIYGKCDKCDETYEITINKSIINDLLEEYEDNMSCQNP